MKFLLGFLSALVLLAGIFLIVVYSGSVSIKATDKEEGTMEWILETTMENAVKSEAEDIKIPNNLNDPENVQLGFEHYKEMCEVCHGGPGVKRTELSKGLNPNAPEISHAAEEWNEQEIFWIIKHGIKMTGMPAWGGTHSDNEIWAITAFVKKAEKMSPEEYRSYSTSQLSGESGQENHSH